MVFDFMGLNGNSVLDNIWGLGEPSADSLPRDASPESKRKRMADRFEPIVKASAIASGECIACTAWCWPSVDEGLAVDAGLLYAEAKKLAKKALIEGAKEASRVYGVIDGVTCTVSCLEAD